MKQIPNVAGWMLTRLGYSARRLGWPDQVLEQIVSSGDVERLEEIGLEPEDVMPEVEKLLADWPTAAAWAIALIKAGEARP